MVCGYSTKYHDRKDPSNATQIKETDIKSTAQSCSRDWLEEKTDFTDRDKYQHFMMYFYDSGCEGCDNIKAKDKCSSASDTAVLGNFHIKVYCGSQGWDDNYQYYCTSYGNLHEWGNGSCNGHVYNSNVCTTG